MKRARLRDAPLALLMAAGLALAAATIIAMALWVPPAHACVICLPYPKKTSADFIVESNTVVFARENPAKPFTFSPVEILKGQYDGEAIPFLVDSATSRMLQLDPASKVVLALDRPGGTWHHLAIARSELQVVMRAVATWDATSKTVHEWNATSNTLHERAVFFAPYLGHRERALATLAFLEVARAPYATIRDLKATVGRDEIYRVINAFFYVEWHGLYILMLGMSDRPDDIAFVRRRLEISSKLGISNNLGAYATAFVEMVGQEAVMRLTSDYFARPDRSRNELLEVVNALSVHGTGGRVELQAEIVDAFGALLERHPELAGYVAKNLYDWKVVRFESRLREILRGNFGLDEASQLAVTVYLSGADKGRSAGWSL